MTLHGGDSLIGGETGRRRRRNYPPSNKRMFKHPLHYARACIRDLEKDLRPEGRPHKLSEFGKRIPAGNKKVFRGATTWHRKSSRDWQGQARSRQLGFSVTCQIFRYEENAKSPSELQTSAKDVNPDQLSLG